MIHHLELDDPEVARIIEQEKGILMEVHKEKLMDNIWVKWSVTVKIG